MNNQELTNRYNQWHQYNKVNFYLEDFMPDYEECRILILKLVEQVVRDYLAFKDSLFLHDQYAWITAASFIFDDDFRLQWGDIELSAEDLLGIVDINIDWFRTFVRQRTNHSGENNGTKKGRSRRDTSR